jgi:predicted esterase
MLAAMTAHSLSATTHGRYLVREGEGGLLVGFHGYGESAEKHLAELEKIPGAESWMLVAVQALHRFYNQRTGEVIGSWMTSQDRELAIADNVAYVAAVVAALPTRRPLVFAGFSQGAAMAYRVAVHIICDGLLILGGDLPPDVAGAPVIPSNARDLNRHAGGGDPSLPLGMTGAPHARGVTELPILIGRGRTDDWYSAEKLEQDLRFLPQAQTCLFDGRHEWTDAFREAAGKFLASLG